MFQSSSVKWDGDPALCPQHTKEVSSGIQVPRHAGPDGKVTVFLQTRTKQLHPISWRNRAADKFNNWQMAAGKGVGKPRRNEKGYCKDSVWRGSIK
jgi:hypothetical protein